MIRRRPIVCLLLAHCLVLCACQYPFRDPQTSDPAMLQWGGPDRPPDFRAVLLDSHELSFVTAEYAATWTDIYHGPVLLHADGSLNPAPLDDAQLQAFRDLCQPLNIRRRISVLISPDFDVASRDPELAKRAAGGIAAFLRRFNYAGARLEWTTPATRDDQQRLVFIDAVIQAAAGESREIELVVQPGDNLPASLLSRPARLHLMPPDSTPAQLVSLADLRRNLSGRIIQGADRKTLIAGVPMTVILDPADKTETFGWLAKQNIAGYIVLPDE